MDNKHLAEQTRPKPDNAASDSCTAQVRSWDSTFYPSLSFFETTEHNMHYGAHLHDTMEIIWTRSTESELIVRGRRFRMHQGDAIIIAPNEIHSGGSVGDSPFSFASLHVPPAVIEKLLEYGLLNSSHIFRMPAFQFIDSRYANIIYHELVESLPFTVTRNEQLLCLSDILRKLFNFRHVLNEFRTVIKNYHPAINRVQTFINSEFTEQIDFGQLATEVDLNQRYLISLFKSITGIPPHQYQIALRVDLARRLLSEKLPLSNVASKAGFADQSHFNRHFKRIYGVTPGTFRNAIRPF
jgi:AraC-like DNA-binding protein